MKSVRSAGVWLALLWSGETLAHAHLTDSSPADGSRVAAAPAALQLNFSEAAQLTALSFTRNGGVKQKLAVPAAAQAHINVPLPALAAGDYIVSWRALGSDGHLVPGHIRFTLTQ